MLDSPSRNSVLHEALTRRVRMENFSFRVASEIDAVDILDFKNLFFHNCEPLELAHPESGHKSRNIGHLLDAIGGGTVLMAVEKESDSLVGILIAAPIESDESEKIKIAAKEIGDKKLSDIMNFLAYIESKANFCNRFDVHQSLHIHVVSVHPVYRGQQIAQNLVKFCLDVAKAQNFKLISIDCTSSYSTRIAEGFDMDCISIVTYPEYNNYLGKCLFIANPPHNEIKSFAKRL